MAGRLKRPAAGAGKDLENKKRKLIMYLALTRLDGRTVGLPIDIIKKIEPHGTGTIVSLRGVPGLKIEVTESIEKINKIMKKQQVGWIVKDWTKAEKQAIDETDKYIKVRELLGSKKKLNIRKIKCIKQTITGSEIVYVDNPTVPICIIEPPGILKKMIEKVSDYNFITVQNFDRINFYTSSEKIKEVLSMPDGSSRIQYHDLDFDVPTLTHTLEIVKKLQEMVKNPKEL